MSILILNRNAPYPFDSWLDTLDEELLILTTAKRAKEIKSEVVEGFSNYENNGRIEIAAAKLFEKYHYHTLVATSEFDIFRAAKIRDVLGLKGQKTESALAFRDKVMMKDILSANGIDVPAYRKVESAIDIYDFVMQHDFPIVVKPVSGSGSEGVHIIKDMNALESFVESTELTNFEVEKFVEGDMYHIDGLVLNGRLVFSWPSKYINGCLSHKEGLFNASYQLEPGNPLVDRLKQYIIQVIDALPTPEDTAFHAEVFLTPDNRLVFCEIASRRGGGYIPESIEQSFGIDVTKLSVQSQCGIEVSLPEDLGTPRIQSGFLLMPAKNGEITNLVNEYSQKWITKYKIFAKVGDQFNGADSSLDYIASFLITGNNEIQVKERLIRLAEEFEKNTLWRD